MPAPQTTSHLRIDGDRLWRNLSELGEIGAYEEPETGLRGVRRLALSDEDIAGRALVLGWMREAGLAVRTDRIGNTYARRPGRDPDLAPVMIGSHLDTVATAGRFDGCLGVLAGLEVIRTLTESGVETERALELAIFTEEEGIRFNTGMLGSSVAAGRIGLAEARALTDRQGTSVRAELDRHGLAGEVGVPIAAPHAYLECHIEQGPVLQRDGRQVGVVGGIQAITWMEIEITGKAAHAGATPYEMRRSASLAAALITVRAHELVECGNYGPLVTTVGRLEVAPGCPNIVPAYASMTIDMRGHDADGIHRAEADLEAYLGEVERITGTSVVSRIVAKTAPVHFPDDMRDLIAKKAANLGLRFDDIFSGAGHDAGQLARLCPAGMVFVPGLYDGISHNPREYSTPGACADGANLLLQVTLELADQG